MIDFNKELVSALDKVLPTYYEMALTQDVTTPCISYMELNNYSTTENTDSSTMGYSRITYQVKVWGNSIGVLNSYAVEVDKALRAIGFKRISSGELYDINSTMIQKILTYECLALENYE
jgi:hypothetical protein